MCTSDSVLMLMRVCLSESPAEFSSLQLASCPSVGQRLWQPRQWQPRVITKGNCTSAGVTETVQWPGGQRQVPTRAGESTVKTAEDRDCFLLRELLIGLKLMSSPLKSGWRYASTTPHPCTLSAEEVRTYAGSWTGLNGRSFDIMRYSYSLERTPW